VSVIDERLPWLETFQLERGSHSPDGKACIMEAAAYISGEPWSDHPECVSPVIGTFLRNWNDALPDEDRDRLLRPYITRVIGTNTGKRDDKKRAWLATDWLARECAPAFLRLAGLMEHAEALEGLAALTSAKRATAARPMIAAAGDAAWAAAGDAARAAAGDAVGAAAGDAAGAAAWAAAGDAAWAAAGDAARAAAGDAAWDAAGDAARAAAGAAARAALEPTVKILQPSALLLLDRMIEVGRK
jgi:hypothetical protein